VTHIDKDDDDPLRAFGERIGAARDAMPDGPLDTKDGIVLLVGDDLAAKLSAVAALARERQADAYRIDLSRVVSQYIGETEKNLDRIFNAAAQSGAVLLFDEADALFGKRTEVKDAHDRYANVEIGYFLGRVDAHPTPVIVSVRTTSELSEALLRRAGRPIDLPSTRRRC
jgi:SpoVK/Ycf46/Vps4 family AAA+-type ATPase